MIQQGMWRRLEAAGARHESPIEFVIIFCGWDPRDPRRAQYEAYKGAWVVGAPDPAFTKCECVGRQKMYHFDHTKVPVDWTQSAPEVAVSGDQTLETVGEVHWPKDT